MADQLSTRTRRLALAVLCVGDLMIVVDSTDVNIALPSIRSDLGFGQTSLAWVVNAYMLTFAGFMLLAGRLGDLFGHRRLFLCGTAAFTLASVACGVATTKGMLPIFRRRNLTVSTIVNVLWAAAISALFFTSTLYLQLVLGYSPLEVGLAFLPGNVIMMAFSLGLSAKLVTRYGFRAPLAFGLASASLALLWLARAPVDGSFLIDVLPAMVLIGIGAGLVFNPILTAAMSDIEPENSGLASGITNTAFMTGGALDLALLASAASARARHLADTGHGALAALTGGYHVVFTAGWILGLSAAAIGAIFLRDGFAPAGIHAAEAALEAT
jgi:MFS family permease